MAKRLTNFEINSHKLRSHTETFLKILDSKRRLEDFMWVNVSNDTKEIKMVPRWISHPASLSSI